MANSKENMWPPRGTPEGARKGSVKKPLILTF